MNRTTATTCPLDCPDACGVLVESDATGRFARLRGNPAHTWSRGHLCAKTQSYGDVVDAPNRLLVPLVRSNGVLVETSWERALDLVAARVSAVRGEDVLALSYGGSMGLVQRKFPLRAMHALGATLHDGGVCDATSTAGYECVLGRCLGPDLERVEEADLLVIWGSDVVRTVQHLQPPILRMQKRCVPVVVVDVWRTETMRDVEKRGGRGFVIRPGTDAQLALCLARIAFELGFVDHAALERDCVGAAEFETHCRSAHDLEETSAVTGLDVGEIVALAQTLRAAANPFFKSGVGWTRRRNGAMSMRALASLCAVLGHGERLHYESFAHFDLAEDAIVRPDLRPVHATQRVVRQVELGRRLDEGEFRAVFVWCHDPAVTLPESARFQRGFARDDLFTVVHDHFLTETAALADVVLPATTFVEHADLYRSYGHRTVQLARAACTPRGEARSNVDTFAALAKRLDLPRETWDVTAESVCAEALEASRARFTDEELARVLAHEPVKLSERAYADRGTPSGKYELFSASEVAAGRFPMARHVADEVRERGAFRLVSAPSIYTHNATYSHSARHAKRAGKPRAFVNSLDAHELGVGEGELVTLVNERARVSLALAVDDSMPRGLVRVDGLPRAADVPERVGINALVAGDVSDLGDGNVLYSTRVDLVPAHA